MCARVSGSSTGQFNEGRDVSKGQVRFRSTRAIELRSSADRRTQARAIEARLCDRGACRAERCYAQNAMTEEYESSRRQDRWPPRLGSLNAQLQRHAESRVHAVRSPSTACVARRHHVGKSRIQHQF